MRGAFLAEMAVAVLGCGANMPLTVRASPPTPEEPTYIDHERIRLAQEKRARREAKRAANAKKGMKV